MTRTKKILAWGGGAALLLALLIGVFVWVTIRDLPDTATLSKYTPPLPSTVRAADGTVLTSFTRERRIYLGSDDPETAYVEISKRTGQVVDRTEQQMFGGTS